jgi:hypothetical protein
MNIVSVKELFFDRQKIIDKTTRATRKILSKFGAFVRTRSKSSIKKAKKSSVVGSPPKGKVGKLKKSILFSFDPSTESVVIGPINLDTQYINNNGKPVSGNAASVLESGGKIQVMEGLIKDYWKRINIRAKNQQQYSEIRVRTVSIGPRPFMGPAFQSELVKMPSMWKNSIK